MLEINWKKMFKLVNLMLFKKRIKKLCKKIKAIKTQKQLILRLEDKVSLKYIKKYRVRIK